MNVLAAYSAAAPYITSMFVGLMLAVLLLLGKRKFFRGKILCIFYTRDDKTETVLLRPNENSMLNWIDKGKDRGAYIFNAEFVRQGRFITEGLPSLSYIEGIPSPLDVRGKVTVQGITAKELSADFSDKISRDLVAATSEGGTMAAEGRKIQNIVVIGLAGLGLFLVGIAYLIISKSNEIKFIVSGG